MNPVVSRLQPFQLQSLSSLAIASIAKRVLHCDMSDFAGCVCAPPQYRYCGGPQARLQFPASAANYTRASHVLMLLHMCRNPFLMAGFQFSLRPGGELNHSRRTRIQRASVSASVAVGICICVYDRRIPPYDRLMFVVSACDVPLRTRCRRHVMSPRN